MPWGGPPKSRNSFEIAGEKGDLESCASTLWHKNTGLCSTRSRWSTTSCLSPVWCHVTAASSGLKTALLHTKKPTCARPRQGMSATHSFPPRRPSCLYCFHSVLLPWSCRVFPAESSPPTSSELQSHLPGSMVSVGPCQSWWCQLPNTSVSHKIYKSKRQQQQQKTFPIVPLALKFPDLFKATSKCGCILPGFSVWISQYKDIIRDVLEWS